MLLERFFSSGNRPPLMMFDFDGVICNSLEAVLPEIEMVFSEVGFTGIKTREELISLLDGNVFLRLTAAGFPMGKLKWLGNRFKSHQEEVYQRIDPFPGLLRLLTDWRNLSLFTLLRETGRLRLPSSVPGMG